jgi:hypothetical protein
MSKTLYEATYYIERDKEKYAIKEEVKSQKKAFDKISKLEETLKAKVKLLSIVSKQKYGTGYKIKDELKNLCI